MALLPLSRHARPVWCTQQQSAVRRRPSSPMQLLLLVSLLVTCWWSPALADPSCPPLTAEEVSKMSTTELVAKLTAPCRYDRFQRPDPGEGRPVHVHSRVHVYFLGAIEAQNLRFTAHILLMFRWKDPRLALPSEARGVNLGANGGQGLLLRDKIWVPHVYLSNERESVVMGAEKKDVRINVHADGTVQQSLRMKVTLYCLMNLQKFPFDQQQCPLILESWTYNTSDLRLSWETHRPVSVNSQLLLTEYRLIDTRTLSAEQAAGHARGLAVEPPHPKLEPPSEVSEAPDADQNDTAASDGVFESDHAVSFNGEDLQFFTETGNFSSLEIRFHLAREVGHYVMDYFMPSILLVVMSWVSFWLDPNAIPGRTTLGTSTMLTFITLTRNTGSSLPKVSYIKATEIWFLVCTGFIFGSLLEFAFVNTIWRRKKEVSLKKVNSKYILKSTMTPRMARRALSGSVGSDLDRCQSWPRVDGGGSGKTSPTGDGIFFQSANQLTVNSIDSFRMTANNGDSCATLTSSVLDDDCHSVSIPVPGDHNQQQPPPAPKPVTKMTPQEIAHWIDVRSRLWFPIAFLLFNALYWGFVWI